jgi:hypothetical protein
MPVIGGGLIVGSAPDYQFADAGGDSPSGLRVLQEVLSGTGAFRQGAFNLQINRAAAEADSSWDGNPDTGLNISATNRATGNVAGEGALRGLQVAARNRGTNINWVLGANISSRNDSGMQATQLHCLDVRIENFGNVATEIVGIDVNLSDENSNVDPHDKYGIRIRNTDASGMGAVDAAIHVTHTSTNGFTAFAHLGALTDGGASSSSTPSSAAVGALVVKVAGDLRYIPLYAASTF